MAGGADQEHTGHSKVREPAGWGADGSETLATDHWKTTYSVQEAQLPNQLATDLPVKGEKLGQDWGKRGKKVDLTHSPEAEDVAAARRTARKLDLNVAILAAGDLDAMEIGGEIVGEDDDSLLQISKGTCFPMGNLPSRELEGGNFVRKRGKFGEEDFETGDENLTLGHRTWPGASLEMLSPGR